MLKKSALIAIISLYASSHFGSTFTTYEGGASIMRECTYTLTASGKGIRYLDLLEIAAGKRLKDPSTFLVHLELVIKQQDADPNWAMSPKDYAPFYEALMCINEYSDIQSHRFKQPADSAPYIESKLLETDINYAVGLLQSMTYKAKQRFYTSED
ncbi:hypothetical protein [Candidatus Bodocaedibacter vickermanii]|uniref:Uncharacterized protein n=1 Tax=Candidatus Bodocaedibacter vickermanii TaxID=2741701 RepID=A0A7L9RUZ4_9PROT|nr:hypothetical protein CPBP_01164 [Candidatus Paracaedibacteraceae bacterium 'Lake Konstanz']